ncbi:MAG TPA: proline iminopeptidase-family hydrolase [Woeseiaceae bacterium]|nr:proline iminopeptidase-family hydrolase [Woeseiaceae bacterium]
MPDTNATQEGYASFGEFRTRFRVVGQNRSRRPLLYIHDGPGYGHEYLWPLEAMRSTGRQVVFYDQLGCGGSALPDDGIEWSVGLFLEELAAVREAAQLSHCHLLGHGWGGMLALEYALSGASGLESLVLSSTVASVPLWRIQLAQLMDALPEAIRAPLQQYRASGSLDSPPCRCIVDAFLRRHLCRMNPWPDCLERSVAEAHAHPEAATALLGPCELEPSAGLAEWDLSARLGEIDLPTLVMSGRHDLAPPPASAQLYQGIPGSEWVVFEHSAHVPHLEEPLRYLEVLDGFLGKHEAAPRQRA